MIVLIKYYRAVMDTVINPYWVASHSIVAGGTFASPGRHACPMQIHDP